LVNLNKLVDNVCGSGLAACICTLCGFICRNTM
jgi:hypothetical protein